MHRNDKLHGSWFKEVYLCIVMISSMAPGLKKFIRASQ